MGLIAQADEGNQGRTDLLLGGGASYALDAHLSLSASLKVPLVSLTNVVQISYPALLSLGLTYR